MSQSPSRHTNQSDLQTRRNIQLRQVRLQSLSASRSPSLRPDSPYISPVSSPKREAADELPSNQNRHKRQRVDASVDNAYRGIFEGEANEFVGNDLRDEIVSLDKNKTQLGTTVWTALEKANFFFALDRRGRHDLPGISSMVGTKSLPEVAQYLDLLKNAECNRWLTAPRISLLDFQDFLSAVEVDQDLDSTLTNMAESFERYESKLARRVAKDKYGEFGVLTEALASELFEQTPDLEGTMKESSGSLAFANHLLNLPRMLQLSRDVFMNSDEMEDNWTSLNFSTSGPSIIQEAFIDLSTLVLALVERIVTTVIFLASSRVQVMETDGRGRTRNVVKAADVLAALETLKLPTNSRMFWAQCPKRCRLKVVESARPIGIDGRGIRHDVIEQLLLSDHVMRQVTPEDYYGRENREEEQTAHDESHEEDESDDPDGYLDFQADKVDRERQDVDDQRIRKLLDLPERDMIEVERPAIDASSTYSKQQMMRQRKKMDDLRDWRDWMDPKPEWERYRHPIARAEFQKDTNKGRDADLQISSSDIGDESSAAIDRSSESAEEQEEKPRRQFSLDGSDDYGEEHVHDENEDDSESEGEDDDAYGDGYDEEKLTDSEADEEEEEESDEEQRGRR